MQNHPKPDLKLILRPKEDFRDIFQPGWPGWPGPCNQRLSRTNHQMWKRVGQNFRRTSRLNLFDYLSVCVDDFWETKAINLDHIWVFLWCHLTAKNTYKYEKKTYKRNN
jgi:hypothetical protein